MEKQEKQPKRRSSAGIIILIILLLLAGAAGFLYYSAVKAPVELDNPQQMAASKPMAVTERFQFSAADQTAQIKLDVADIWSLILEQTGNDFLDIINGELSSYGLSVSGCAIRIDEEGLRLDLEAYYKQTRLVVKVPCSLEVSNQQIRLSPAEVKLGVVNLPIKSILSGLELEYDLCLPVISDVTKVSFAQDGLLLAGPMEQDVRTLVPVDEKLYQTAVFCDSMQPVVDALQTQAGYTSILSYLEKNPADVEALYRDLFTLSDPEVTGEYLEKRHGLTQRFFPGIDFSDVAQAYAALTEQRDTLLHSLEQFFNGLLDDYNNKRFRLSEGVFLRGGKAFQAAEYGTGEYDALFEVLDPESFFLVLVDAEDGFIRNTSSFYRIADEKQQFTQPVDFDRTYILGCVLRSIDGEPFLMYDAEVREGNTYSRCTKLCPLTEEDVSSLQVPGKFGIWTG